MTLKRFLLIAALLACCKKEKLAELPAVPQLDVNKLGNVPPPASDAAVAAAAPAKTAPGAAPTPPKEEEEDKSVQAWFTHSGDGTATLHEKPSGPGRCLLECKLGDGSVAWANGSAECIAEKADRKFVAKDCSRSVVFIPAPSRAKSWRATEVIRVYKKDKLDYKVMGVVALPNEKLYKASRSWLKGCYQNSGEPPHYSSDGNAVEYETIDNKQQSVPLQK